MLKLEFWCYIVEYLPDSTREDSSSAGILSGSFEQHLFIGHVTIRYQQYVPLWTFRTEEEVGVKWQI